MYSLQHGDELVFRPPSIIQRDRIMQDLTMDRILNKRIDNCSTTRKRGRQRSSVTVEENNVATSYDGSVDLRKLLHRDTERQRRQELANLYASLQSLIPSEYLKGKRSKSDHVQETINYIEDKKKSIKELGLKRDELKKLNISGYRTTKPAGSSTNFSPNIVRVNPCLSGAEILISSSSVKEERFPLISRVLNELLGRGFDVVNCVSTKSNDRSIHKIHCEASNVGCSDLSILNDRLTDIVINL